MNRLFILLLVIAVSSVAAAAQTDYKRAEFFAGYSHGQVDGSTYRFQRVSNDIGDTGAFKFHGVTASGVYNVSRYVGVKGDVSATFHGGDFNFPINPTTSLSGDAQNSLYNILGGVQFKDNSNEKRFKPFAHILVGVGHARTNVTATCAPVANCGGVIIPSSSDETGLAGAIGGGIDIKLNDRFDLRLIQVDYNPVNLDSGMLHNARFGIGIVFK